MNNLPLQPLVWTQKNLNPLAELELTAYSALHEYEITEPKQGKFEIKKTRLGEPDKKSEIMTGFTSAKNAQDEAWAHYQRSMQPYVKPIPTWIDANEQLPQVDVDTQFICAYDSAIEPYVKVTYFDKSLNEFDHEHEGVLAWMPIPEFSTMQNLHKGERCEWQSIYISIQKSAKHSRAQSRCNGVQDW